MCRGRPDRRGQLPLAGRGARGPSRSPPSSALFDPAGRRPSRQAALRRTWSPVPSPPPRSPAPDRTSAAGGPERGARPSRWEVPSPIAAGTSRPRRSNGSTTGAHRSWRGCCGPAIRTVTPPPAGKPRVRPGVLPTRRCRRRPRAGDPVRAPPPGHVLPRRGPLTRPRADPSMSPDRRQASRTRRQRPDRWADSPITRMKHAVFGATSFRDPPRSIHCSTPAGPTGSSPATVTPRRFRTCRQSRVGGRRPNPLPPAAGVGPPSVRSPAGGSQELIVMDSCAVALFWEWSGAGPFLSSTWTVKS